MSLADMLEQSYLARPKDALQKIRQAGWGRFLELGLPHTKSEPFRHFPLTKLYNQWSEPVAISRATPAQIVFTDGAFDTTRSSIPTPAICLPLDEAMRTHSALLQHHLTHSLKNESDPFTALNAALHPRGAFLYIPPECEVTLTLSTTSSRFTFPRLQIFLGTAAKLTLFQTSAASIGVIDCHLDRAANFSIYDHLSGTSLHSLRTSLKRDSTFQSFTFSEGGPFCRSSLRATLMEEGSSAQCKGLCAVKDHMQTHIHVTVEHAAPHCTSRQHFKSLIGKEGLSQFTGNILVRSIAQKTEAYQLNQNLLLHPQAKAYATPNLEIFADDVKASHGATATACSPEELFYLQARGLSLSTAQQLLAQSFAQELVRPLPSSLWKEQIQQQLNHFFQ